MKTYFADTNIFLRYIIPEETDQKEEAEKYFTAAKNNSIIIVVCQIVIFELSFALDKFYKQPKIEIYNHLKRIVSAPYFQVEDRETFLEALKIFYSFNVDFPDAFLHCKAKNNRAEVLSFDRHFKKIDKI